MMGWYGYGIGWGGGLVMLAVIGLAVGLVWLIVRWNGDRQSSNDGDVGTILRGRMARGEIGEEEYERMRVVLEAGAPGAMRSRRTLVAAVVAGVLVLALAATTLAWTGAPWGPRAAATSGGLYRGLGPGMMRWFGYPSTTPGLQSGIPLSPTARAPRVGMNDDRFTPDSLSVTLGTTVTFVNDDRDPHTVTAADRSWSSGDLRPGASYGRTFDRAGTFGFVCLYHPWMVGTISVQP